ncbi:MAG TPA: trypsin-like peptidase domain-containing protein [Gemmatimonadales bacterium]|jgi:serine protease Do
MVVRRVALILAVLMLPACGHGSRAAAQQGSTLARTAPSRAIDAQRRTAIVDASAKVAPAVVSIHVILPTPRQTAYDMFFGESEGTPQGFGTGFILRSDGIVVTNQHVVANAQQITVTLEDGTDVPGRVLGEDPVTDIAVIKIDRTHLPVVTVGKSSDLMIGEWAIALGNPYTYLLGNAEPTVTAGVISATGRNILPTGNLQGMYVDMIQTDAAINPGNSGGPLVNALGEVIGVNSSIFSNSGESVGLGFAIPIERVVRVANEIIATSTVRRAWPGLEVAGAQNLLDWKQTGGVTVQSVAPDGPAAKAGIKIGDILIKANGRTLRTFLDWEAVKLDLKVGDAIDVTVKSAGRTADHRIVTGDLPTLTAARVRVLQGLDLVTVTPAVRDERRITTNTSGALILKVQPDIAQITGLQEGDIIFGINQQPLQSADEVAKAIDALRPGQNFILWIERGGQRGQIQLRTP